MNKIILKIALLFGLLGLAYVYKTFDPAQEDSLFPPCPVYTITDWKCPGCGSQRAVHSLLNGRLSQAWKYNPLLIIVLPYLIIAGLGEYGNIHLLGKKGNEFLTSRYVIWTFFVGILLYWILRNVV